MLALLLATQCVLTPLVVTRHASGWLELQLNRPEKLNALSSNLVDLLLEQVVAARSDNVPGVLLSAAPGRAFCAGGDIREVAALPISDGMEFLRKEYLLMLSLHKLQHTKPVVSLADGFVIGAGAGLFMAAGTRIATAGSSFSMPECVLGITPDVGASDFLQTMPGSLGRWASLSGARLAAPMMTSTGLATHAIVADDGPPTDAYIADLRERLLVCEDAAQVAAALQLERVAAQGISEFVGDDTLERLQAAAERSFGGGLTQLDERLAAEEEEGDSTVSAWAKDARAKLSRGCPAAVIVANECARASFGEESVARRAAALGMELVANQALAARPDFQEGVSCAVGVKKGQAPEWEHVSIEKAAQDPAVQALLERVRQAEPLSLE